MAALLGLSHALMAQTGGTGTGTIVGSAINDSTQKVLERATVTVIGTNLITLSAADGSFRLIGVPAGPQKVQVGYAGLEDEIAAVSVVPGGVATVNFALKSEVVQMSEFRVSTEREGNAYAIQQQKLAESLRNVVSADAFGIVSDGNPGEFLKLMPGIQMDYVGIEPRGLMVRGMEPNLNLVMINGNQAAAANSSSTGRTFEFDQITIDNIESMEVFKASIPSMPANAIGGIVNMVTRSAFLQKGRRVAATVNLTGNNTALTTARTSGPSDSPTYKIHPGGSFTYSDSFLEGRLGLVFSISQVNDSAFGGTAYDAYTYISPPADPAVYPNTVPVYVNQLKREDFQTMTVRTGGSLNLDYKVSDTATAFVRTTFTNHDYQFRSRFLILNTGTGIVPGFTSTHVEALPTTGNAQQNTSMGDKLNKAASINVGMKHRLGPWTVNYDGALSRATNHYGYLPRMFGGITLTIPNVGFTLDKTSDGSALAKITQTSGPDIYNLANYVPTGTNQFTTSNRDSIDRLTAGKFSVRRDFVAQYPFYVESGASYQKQERSIQQPNRRWSYAGPDGIVGTADDTTQANMQQFAEQDYTPNIWFHERAPNAWISPFQLAKLYNQTPQAFIEDQGYAYQQAFVNNRFITETISAAYAMANVKFGKLDVLFGTRVEQTQEEGEGARLNGTVNLASLADVIAKYSRTKGKNDYTSDPFKYLHLTWHATKDLQARASYSEAIGRPNFGNIIPGVTVTDSSRTVTTNNPGLIPQQAKNLDVSIEWYPSGTSSLTAAWFKKDIKNYIVNNSETITAPLPALGLGPEVLGYTLNTSFNLGNATVEGYEAGGRYRLKFLPAWLNTLEVFGNYTRLYKTQGNFAPATASTGFVPLVYNQLPNITPKIWNVGANYTTPDSKWFFLLKANFLDNIPTNINGRPQQQTNSRLVYDAEARYTLTPRYTLSLAGRNVSSAQEGGSQLGRSIRQGTGGGVAFTLTLGARF
jgi:iron complex outermembrane receptor protein